MKLQIVSDLHCEFYRDGGAALIDAFDPTDVDVLVVAGDLHTGMRIRPTLEAFARKYTRVVYLPGNHEFYREDALDLEREINALSIPGVSILNPGDITIDGVRFVGAPLWFGPLSEEQTQVGLKRFLNDFNYIRRFEPWVYEKHAEHRRFLSERLHADVIVSHHMPARECIHPQYATSPLTHFFHAQVDDLVAESRAQLWVHGHTHSPVDVKVGAVRIIANPKGYPQERGTRFNERLIVEL